MFKVLAITSCMVVAAFAGHHSEEKDYYAPPHYKFEYSVEDPHTHDIKKQTETRKDDQVKGYYSLKEADGTTREVHYTSDHKNGFNAEVHRSGHAVHPQDYKSSSETFFGKGDSGKSGYHDAVSSASFSSKY
ncbi:cuticle protein 19 [Halyomorpha halys]|uniref:cuticle protein 19 n=1 Tax=Halyomorpha halys TaxID=286706 RepID=UPI0006D4DEC2|nr:cuticle protein 19-like [Halyomorpha halys]KAE8573256.1 Cuticle Protein CPR RR-2 [Halyomorpha halys]